MSPTTTTPRPHPILRIQPVLTPQFVTRAHSSTSSRGRFRPAAWQIIVSLSAILPAKDAWAQIEGRVVDLFGKPVSAATVSIQGLRFRTQTNDNGEFRLEYVPGSMVILVAKAGYLPSAKRGTVSLNLSTVTRVPIEDLVLVLLPPSNGLFLVGKTGYVGAPRIETLQEQSGTSTFDQRIVWSVRGPYVRAFPDSLGLFWLILRGFELSTPGELSEAQLKVVRVQARGVVAEASRVLTAITSMRADVAQDIELYEFADGIVGSVVTGLSDGLYAICEWRQFNMFITARVPRICYPIALGDAVANAALPEPATPTPSPRDSSKPPPPTPGVTSPVPPKVSAVLAAPADPRLFYLPTKSRATALEDFGNKAPTDERSSPELSGYATGINLAGPGDAVAAADGRVVQIVDLARKDKDFGFGNTVILEHVLESGDTLYSLYAHLAGFSSEIRVGQMLRRGTVIGPIGSSGYGREKYWLSTRASPRCVRPTLNINPTFCVRLHFELKSKPVLENPSGEKVCRTATVLGSKSSLCYGYSPQDPTELGYLDPKTVFGRVRVKADTAPSRNQPSSATPEKWEAYIQQGIAQSQLPAPRTEWREILAMTFGRAYDNYQELYVRAVNRRNLAVDALVSANEFLKKNDLTSVEKFAALYARHYQESNELLRDADRVFAGGVRITADQLNAIYRATSEASKYGWLLLCGPKCYEVADYTFLMVDFAVDYGLGGADEATKAIVIKAITKVLLDASGLAEWTDKRVTQVIGQSGLYRFMEQQLSAPAAAKSITKVVGTSGGYAAQRVTDEGIQQVVRAALDFVNRSRR